MFQVKEQTITDANTGVQVAFGRHDAAPAQPVADGEDAPPIVAQPSQYMRITAGGKVSTVFFTPDGDIRNIQAHPPLPGPNDEEPAPDGPPVLDVDTDEAQPWKPEEKPVATVGLATADVRPYTYDEQKRAAYEAQKARAYTYDETSKAIDADIADDNADDAKTAEEFAKIDNDVAQRKSRETDKALSTPPIEG